MTAKPPIIKTVIHRGEKYVPITNGSKVHFHFQTWKLSRPKVLIDDSKKIGKKEPMVLVIGLKFKLEVWEAMVKMMSVGEVASFKIRREMVYGYPYISKTIRELGKESTNHHTCTMSLHTEGIGYADLDDLINNPCDLEFVIELLKIETSNEYEKEIWQLNEEERLKLVPVLKEKGNKLYKEKLYDDAEELYRQAVAICEQLMLRERKEDEEWQNLNKLKLPILLNYAQCKLVKGEYYSVIQHCNTVLEHDKDNGKALYKRAKAHVGAWNPKEAEEDFKTLKALDPSMTSLLDKEIENLRMLIKEKTEQDKNNLRKLFVS